MKKHLIVANWKMYIEKPEAAKRFAAALKRKLRTYPAAEVVLAPSFPLLPVLAQALGVVPGKKTAGVRLAAQCVSSHERGPHTGEVSAVTLRELGVSAVIVGHSERRALGESNDEVQGQLTEAQAAGLISIVCVGEREREAGGAHFEFIAGQLRSALAGKASSTKLIVAYEPVWAIGHSAQDAMPPSELREMIIFIRKVLADVMGRAAALKVPVLYGGSVEGANAKELLEGGGASGFLVGHASADLDSFIEILAACK